MNESIEQILSLLQLAEQQSDDLLKVELCEQAVRLADEIGANVWQFIARHELITATFMAGEGDRMLVAISWCLGKAEEDEKNVVNWQILLWQCKHVLAYIPCFPSVSRERIVKLCDDVVERYRRRGASLRGPYTFLLEIDFGLGDFHKIEDAYQRWQAEPNDEFTETEDWEDYFRAKYFKYTSRLDDAFEVVQPLFRSPQLSYDTFPWMVSLLWRDMFRRTEWKRLASLFKKSIRISRKSPKYLAQVADYLSFLAMTRNYPQGARLFEEHISWRMKTRVPSARLAFDMNAFNYFTLMLQDGQQTLDLHLPDSFPLYAPEGNYSVEELVKWFEQQSSESEARFNERNENESISAERYELLDLHPHQIDLEI